ncbi:2',3'-cyclic-nucleotide 2'-phosphodiesterase (5'-nucleotidase family) [Caldalkalibacillus uzonensis]|uniref:2',3'-cyclic-nucleotide 2'-phosphodiesterase (5'-nucleotidase family) n=1 Tax=Caldalkalibacillus uzonensis TaxID=353224 RepID=A0ABU0CP40_9BACI|nr:bifunctional UDP-sugar hydrolase/5'-nucleotidase [Caldalkalibacillus uzonensis]MDQ0338182.1 2',3'-cyclic-nucleotide 2'-phosphodiesterase (5'-nucleotidase family) [Caldalkalibacillus uzonensis]
MGIERFVFEVIFTHDLHSHFENWPKVASKIKQLTEARRLNKEPYLLVDIGDHLDRSHFITEGTCGKANVALLNQLAYDYVTIGNNEGITFDYEQLSSLYQDARFKVLINNLFESEGSRPSWCLPYDVATLGCFNVGVIGTTVNFTRFYEQLGWQIKDPFKAVAQSVTQLKEQVDFVLVLSHLGFPRDKKLAEQVQGIDLILGAHTHHFLPNGLKIGRTWIHQVGKFGQYVGCVKVYYDTSLNRFSCYPQAETVQEMKEDAEAVQVLASWAAQAEQHLAQPVTVLDQPLDISWHEETTLGNLLAEAINDWCQTELSMVNTGLILDHLPQGDVTFRDIHRICPHPINACRVHLTGEEIWAILERSLDHELQTLEIKGFGFRGKKLGMMAINGLKVEYHEQHSGAAVITNIYTAHGPLDRQKIYTVATVDMFTFGGIFPEIHEKENIDYFLPEFLRDLLVERLKQGKLERAAEKRWIKDTWSSRRRRDT